MSPPISNKILRLVEQGMSPKTRVRIAACLLFAVLFLPHAANAACGLHFCPRNDKFERAFQLGLAFNQTGYRLSERSGSYSEATPEIQYNPGKNWIFGAYAPILLHIPDRIDVGFGNPTGYIEYRVIPVSSRTMGLGLQAEVPIGNSRGGMADSHFMLVPYLSWKQSAKAFFFSGIFGGGFVVAGEHRHPAPDSVSEAPVFVRPHEEKELLYRATSGIRWNRKGAAEIFINGQHVLHGETRAGNHFLTIGCAFPVALRSTLVTPGFEIPVSSSHRMEWSFGLKLKIGVGGWQK